MSKINIASVEDKKRNYKKGQKGYSTLEVLVVIAVIGLALAALAWGINRMFNSSDVKDEGAAITALLAAVPDLRTSSGYGPSGTDLMPQLIAQNAISSTWPVVSGVPQNVWNGTIAAASAVNAVSITSTNVPAEACNKLTTRLSKSSNFASTTIGSNGPIVGEVSPDTARTQCLAANTIVWTTRS